MVASTRRNRRGVSARPQSTIPYVPTGAWSIRGRSAAIFGLLVCTLALSGAWAQGASAYSLAVSEQSDRSGSVALAGTTYPQSAQIHVFLDPATDVAQVSFFLNDPARLGSARTVEKVAPFDFVGTAADGSSVGLDVATLAAGIHTITAAVKKADASTEVASAIFTVLPSDDGSGPPASDLLFEDNFNGSTVNAADWAAYDSVGHARHGLRRPSAFSVADGMLVVTAKMVNGQIVSGGMRHRLDYLYGRFVVRVKTDVDPTGTMSGVVLTWPKHQWAPDFTENDIYETGAGLNTRNPFRTFIHYGRNSQKYYVHRVDGSQWHVVEMDWRPGLLKIIRDGNVVWSTTNRAVIPDVLHHVSIQLDARVARTLTQPVSMYVDYIRIYRQPPLPVAVRR